MKLTPTALLPFVFTNERGQYMYKDGSPIRWNPMNTVDPKEPYGDKPTERAPLLSDGSEEMGDPCEATNYASMVRDFYEAKINNGELMRGEDKPTERAPYGCVRKDLVIPTEATGEIPEERAPLLSDEDVDGLWDRFGRCVDDKVGMRCIEVRDFYEAKITSGELRVVRTVSRDQWSTGDCCDDSSGGATEWHGYPNFCPGCGAQITK